MLVAPVLAQGLEGLQRGAPERLTVSESEFEAEFEENFFVPTPYPTTYAQAHPDVWSWPWTVRV